MSDQSDIPGVENMPSHLVVREMFERIIAVAQLLKNHSGGVSTDEDAHVGYQKTQDYEADIS